MWFKMTIINMKLISIDLNRPIKIKNISAVTLEIFYTSKSNAGFTNTFHKFGHWKC